MGVEVYTLAGGHGTPDLILILLPWWIPPGVGACWVAWQLAGPHADRPSIAARQALIAPLITPSLLGHLAHSGILPVPS